MAEFKISDVTLSKLKVISNYTRQYADNPRAMPKELRTEIALMMAVTLVDFREFAYLGFQFLGFNITPMQLDIAEYMATCGEKAMVLAPRGQAKTTLSALYAIWKQIQDQRKRVLVVSAAGNLASDIAILIIRFIEQWHLLCYLRADQSRGDRTSYEAYDIHCDLKPVDKAPSIACIGIYGTLQGKRADLLLADDIESTKNGLTQTERDKLVHATKEFSSIVTHGQILYLGTFQSKNSIYRQLPARGYTLRVWTARMPNKSTYEEKYGTFLAPYILNLMDTLPDTGYGLDGSLGAPTDSLRYTENDLVKKEIDWKTEGFHLQYMLDTELSDALRTKLSLSDLIVYEGSTYEVPNKVSIIKDRRYQLEYKHDGIPTSILYRPASFGETIVPLKEITAIIDPAGKGGDEVSFAIGGAATSYIHLLTIGGFAGGMSNENIDKLIDLLIEYDVGEVVLEKNMGHGTVTQLLQNRLLERKIVGISVSDIYNTSQKEVRIINTLSPLLLRHRLVVHFRALMDDAQSCMKYPEDRRWQYSAFAQMRDITTDRGCLGKDDRLDCLEMLVRKLNEHLVQDAEKATEKVNEAKWKEYMDNPLGKADYSVTKSRRNKRKLLRNNRYKAHI